jgi:hypothetical protein
MKIVTVRKSAVLTSATLALLVAVGLTGLPGCSTSRAVISRVTSPEGGKMYAVGVEKTPFYRYGPQQGNGPDEELPRDTVVKLIRHSFGYSKVVIAASGQQGFVASEDLTVASAALVTAAAATPAPQVIAAATTVPSQPAAENFDLQSADASFVPPPEGLPAPDLPLPSVEPSPSE